MPNTADNLELLVEASSQEKEIKHRPNRFWIASLLQFARFSVVGILNTFIDVTTLNVLLWRFPTHNANQLLIYNSLAFILGAINSFCLNKYWTFRRKNNITSSEVARFVALSIGGILCNDIILWISAKLLHPLISNNLLWANISKGFAILGTMTISYLGMRLWVFAKGSSHKRKAQYKS